MNKRKKNYSIVIGLLFGLLLKSVAFDILYISGDSMSPTLTEGELIIFNKLAYGFVLPFTDKLLFSWATPKKNDIILYFKDNKIVVKRCVAISNTPLVFFEDSLYNIGVGENNIPLQEPQYQRLKHTHTVPQGYVFAVGDNYEKSVDSRTYGFVSTEYVLGKALWK